MHLILIIYLGKLKFRNFWKISILFQSFIFFKLVGLGSCCVLLWNRIEWGFEEWIHEVMFFNFWNGTYIVLSGKSNFNSL